MGEARWSMSINSSELWKGDTSFFSSLKSEDDEEALKWAALERLPSWNRMRKGILNIGQDPTEINIQSLGFQERKNLLDRLMRVAHEDHEGFLMRLKDRIDKVGIDFPTIEVRYEQLSISAEAYAGSRGLPSFFRSIVNTIEPVANFLHILPRTKKTITILNDISGIIKPRRLTLLLGPPASGKTTLLLALAGKLSSDLKVFGKVTYNGHEMDEFVPQRTAAYISQHDVHIPELTVRETLSFSSRFQGIGSRYEMLTELARREKAANIKPDPDIDVFMKAAAMEGKKNGVITDYILKILGLDICAETLLGDEMLRGVSGGQKKRVTTGEMLVGPAQALFMDEISNGLDSSTTFQMVNAIRQAIHILGGTGVISLLQPAPETYELFDDIILLSDGQIVYQGSTANVLEFFEWIGFKCPKRKGVADFLQEVTSKKDQEQYWARPNKPYRFVTVREFATAFHSFHVGEKLGRDLSFPFDKRKSHPAALTTSKYGVRKIELLKACADREWLLMKRNSFVYVFRALQIAVMALIAMTMFLRSNLHRNTLNDGMTYMGALYFSLIMSMFNGLSEIGLTVIKLPVFFKQRDYLFYPSWVCALPVWILKIPVSCLEVAIWVLLNYFVIGFDPSAARFFKQYLLLALVHQMSSGLFRFIAVIGRNLVIAGTIASFSLLVIVVLGGYILAHGDVNKWWIWGFWMSPLMYSQNAIFVNEFLGKSWSQIMPGTNQTLGLNILKARGMFLEAKWYWIGVAATIGYVILVNFFFTIALTFLKLSRGSHTATTSEVSMREKQMNIKGEFKKGFIHGRKTDHQTASKTPPTKKEQNFLYDTNNYKKPPMYASDVAQASEMKGMVLPFVPLSLTFDNIRYSVDMPVEMKIHGIEEEKLVLLKGVSGSFRSGVLTALMGVSGAGKTTLMDVLAGRKLGGYIEGNINISGYPKKQETFARVSGYCEQNDIHSPNLTVYESLVFSAWLRLPVDVDSVQKQMFINEVMELVELTPLMGALVGLPGVSGLSTEQRKRLTIAVELVGNPSIIFMDEPTSGLDARAAAIVMRTVRNTVDTGRTVVCTIHQPSIDIFEAFDELFLMKRGGEEIYVGPLGKNSCHLISYFEEIRGVRKIKDGYNPATWMLEETTPEKEDELGVNFSELYKNSDMYQGNRTLMRELSKPHPGTVDLYFPTQYSQSFSTQCMACLWKQRLSYWRNPSYTAVRFFFTIMIAFMFGGIFWGLGKKRGKRQDLFNAMGSMYSAVLFMGISYSTSIRPCVVSIERTVFYREKAAGMYSPFPYAFGQVVVELPYVLAQSVVYGIIVYSMVGFEWTASKLLCYIFFMYFTLLYFTFYGMLAVGVTPNFHVAAVVSSAFYGIWNLFSGFVIPRPRMPVWWSWYYWACPVAWTLYGMLTSQYGDVNEPLDTNETVAEFLRSYFGYRHDFLGFAAFMVVGFAFLFAGLFGTAIKVLNFQKR
ncbi:LOW QUALITY PROTEIN: ABC transporter G family member 44-like [Phalaenopsis equestris]|uniref:LOW QUALITY PROTEIN: ABC transporter G family member 44-like n=1 Tax=Phalaenopsis equestris TaxID=78828 RepID=UPI0009E3854A|nr:LOW QUALITY PROTEIN: ABC transporter G family member 44-like [Phalaenopsis equestris]